MMAKDKHNFDSPGPSERLVEDRDKVKVLGRGPGRHEVRTPTFADSEPRLRPPSEEPQPPEERNIGRILVESGKLSLEDVERVLDLQEREGIYFGDAALKLKLVSEEDVQYALSRQFGYPTVFTAQGVFSPELVTAYKPFDKQAELFRGLRSQLLFNWLNRDHKVLCVVSPGSGEGRSYVAANLAVTFSLLGKQTLLIDADLRSPRQHEIFGFNRRVGLSSMLSGRIKKDELEMLPEVIPFFTRLSVLGAGAVPPNPVELFSGPRFENILDELKRFYDVIIVDSPSGENKADVQTLAAAAGSAMVVLRRDHTKMDDVRRLKTWLSTAGVNVVGAVLNEF
jgi:receptor protein-tyrosine kinase